MSEVMTEVVFERATPVLRSADYARSKAYYVDKLGYTVVEEGGDPARFGIFQRGKSVIFVNAWDGGPSWQSKGAHPGGWEAYVHVRGLDDLAAAFAAADANITRQIELTVYGMREFEVTDPDGNVICFGEDPAR